jgi:hypothetical protein
MEHTISIIWLAIWPILIYVVYRVSMAVLKQKKLFEEPTEEE